MTDRYQDFWRGAFPGLDPAGYRLRHALPDRWVRFHALPGSKRYPETPAEYAELLSRANALGEDVLGDATPCWIVARRYEGAGETSAKADFPLPGFAPSFYWGGGDDESTRAYAIECVWRAGAFDAAIRAIADEAEMSMLWVSQRTNAVFAPYDGGFDVILPLSADVPPMRRRFEEWLSTHPAGL